MADKDDLLYRPEIPTPTRTNETGNDLDVVVTSEGYTTRKKAFDDKAYDAGLSGYVNDGSPKAQSYIYMNGILDNYLGRAIKAREMALELKSRAKVLMEMAIDNLNPYLGNAPAAILQAYSILTGIRFVDTSGNRIPITDPIYTPERETIRCIFRIAGYGNPDANMQSVNDAARNWDSAAVRNEYYSKTESLSAAETAVFGLKLLWLTVKLCIIIAAHYTVGYICHWLKQFDFTFRIPIIQKKVTIKIGSAIANHTFGPVEKAILWIFGYKCRDENAPKVDCNTEAWNNIDFTELTCCTNESLFFERMDDGTMVYAMSPCLERWLRKELDTTESGRLICSPPYRNNEDIEATDKEIAAANMVADYLMVANNNTSQGIMSPADIVAMQASIRQTNSAIGMSTTVESAINSNKVYIKTNADGDTGDCFGYISTEVEMMSYLSTQGLKSSAVDEQPEVINSVLQDVLGRFDESLYKLIEAADKAISKVAALSLWGSSRFFCCWVYLIVLISTIWNTMIKKRQWCPKMECSDIDEYEANECAEAIRREFMYAARLKDSKEVAEAVALLKTLKNIIDIFIKRKDMALFIDGLRLPLHDMWEEMKIVIMTNLSQFLDLLFGPLDAILSGIRGTPEIKNMINNNCFGFGSFLDFLSCLLGNMKASIMDFLAKLMAFTLSDVSIINDMYLCRTRLKSLQALSDLLGLMINLILGLKDCYEPETLANTILQKQVEDQYNKTADLVALAGSKERLAVVTAAAQRIVPDYETGIIPSTDFTPEEVAETERDGTLSTGFAPFNQFNDPYDDLLRIVQMEQGYNVESVVQLVNAFVKDDGTILSLSEFITEVEKISGVTSHEIMESMGERIFQTMRERGEG